MSYLANTNAFRTTGRGLTWRIALGGVLVIAGLGLIVVAASAGDDTPLFMLGGLTLGFGVLGLTTALHADARRHADRPIDPDDPRWSDGIAPKQLAGRQCVECGHKIIIGADAFSCPQCAEPAHVECRGSHERHAHGEVRVC